MDADYMIITKTVSGQIHRDFMIITKKISGQIHGDYENSKNVIYF